MSAQPEQAQKTEAPPVAPKVDPESLALRAQPARAIRFKRGAIVGTAALVSLGLVTSAWLALQPAALQRALTDKDEAPRLGKPSDALSPLPEDYGSLVAPSGTVLLRYDMWGLAAARRRLWPPAPRLVWNATASAPIGLYGVLPGVAPARGEMVIACPRARRGGWQRAAATCRPTFHW